MILLDPDLDPAPAPKTKSARSLAAPISAIRSEAVPRAVRLPSARTLSSFLQAAQQAVRLKGQVTVLLTTDAAIRKLNRQFRGKNKATDVLSFPAEGPGAEGIAGDLAISVTTALGQAAEQRHSLSTEIKVLVLHGLLHLAGYDHEVDDGRMARRERVLRAKLKLPQGLIERVAAHPQKVSSGANAQASSGGANVRAKQDAEKLKTEGGGGVDPRINPIERKRALAPETLLRPLGSEITSFSPASKARTLHPKAHALEAKVSILQTAKENSFSRAKRP